MHERSPDVTNDVPDTRLLFVVNVDWFFLSHRLPIALAAQRAGFRVAVAAADTGKAHDVRRHGFEFIELSITRSGRSLGGELRSLWSVWRAYRAWRPDIVHHVSIKPVIYGTLVAWFHPQVAVVNAVSGLGFMVEGGSAINRHLVLALYRLLLRRPRQLIILQNEDHAELFASLRLAVPTSLRVIHGSGVDVERFIPADQEPESPMIIMVSRMLRDKGVHEFVAAAAKVRRSHPNARFVLVGPAGDDNPTAIDVPTLQAWNESGAVEWWGPREDVADILRSATVFVLPSHHEGMPKALLEAGAAGLPLVASDIPGHRPVVTPQTGLLFPVGDAAALASAIEALLDDPVRRARLGEAARRHIVAGFTTKAVTDRTLEVYAEAVALLHGRGRA